jgi:hypothetical protein
MTLVRPPQHLQIDIDWNAVEADLGTSLPSDYKALIEIYGQGTFGNFVSVFQPVTPFLTVELAHQARRSQQILKHHQDHAREILPFAPGDLQAVAGTDNGDTLYWVKHPNAEPDSWTLTGNGARNTRWPRFPGGLVTFLYEVLSGTLHFPIFPAGFPNQRPVFTPGPPPDPRRIAALRAQGLYRDR